MTGFVLRWRQPSPPVVTQWRGVNAAMLVSVARNPEAPIAGVIGPPGLPGLAGAAGAVGPAGPAGPVGAAGSAGAAGPAGPAGVQGLPGVAGPQGPIGVTGAAGPAGLQGATGPQGLTGATGPAGAQGLVGLTGAAGATGPAGAAGAQGAAGATGPAGAAGATGPIGPAGATGATGLTGAVGPTGAAGPAGATGPQGPAGAAGSGGVINLVEVDLGPSMLTAGKFLISGLSGLTTGSRVRIEQATGPYAGKGTLADEYEMDAVRASGTVTAAGEITAYWTSSGPVRGNFKFLYDVAAASATAALPTFKQANVRNSRTNTASPWNAKAALVRAGSVRARVLCVGDSVTYGQGAGTPDAWTGARPLSYPAKLAAKLAAAGLPAINESMWAGFNSGAPTVANMLAYDSRIAAGAGWFADTGTGVPTAGGEVWANNSDTSALSFTPSIPVDTFQVFYYTDPLLGQMTVDVDGSGSSAINTGVAKSLGSVTKSVALGIHTLNIRRTIGYLRIAGIIAWNSAAKAVDVVNLGWSGSKAGDWNSTVDPWSPLNAITVLAPDLSIIQLGINDWQTAVPPATYAANMAALITRCQQTGSVILCSPHQTSGQDPVTNAYVDALRDLIDSADVRMADLYFYQGSFASLNAKGWMFDLLHGKAPLYDSNAALLSNILTSDPVTVTSSYDPATVFSGTAGVFFDPNDAASVWQDAAGTVAGVVGQPVGRLSDKSGNGNHATQVTAGARPLLRADPGGKRYIIGDGIDDWLRATFTMTGNWTRVSLLRVHRWTQNAHMIGGSTGPVGAVQHITTAPSLRVIDGAASSTVINDATIGYDVVLVERHSGVTTTVKVNNAAYVGFADAGTSLPDGVTLFGTNGAVPSNFAQARLYGMVQINRTLTDPEIAALVAHFNARADVVL